MNDDEIARRLAGLAPPRQDPAAAERVRRCAQAELALARRRAGYGPLAATWSRALAPALLTATVGIYLVWAFTFVENLYR